MNYAKYKHDLIGHIFRNVYFRCMQDQVQGKYPMSQAENASKQDLICWMYRTFFAYHGSRLNNWHSIIRNGLKNMSTYIISFRINTCVFSADLISFFIGYTFNAVNGASYGPGIYLAGEPQTSLGYATNHTAVKTVGSKQIE